jgi:hypothetical protein
MGREEKGGEEYKGERERGKGKGRGGKGVSPPNTKT